MMRHACAVGGETLGVEIRGVYDGVLFWACTGCGWTQNRWDPVRDGRLNAKAREHMRHWAERHTPAAGRP